MNFTECGRRFVVDLTDEQWNLKEVLLQKRFNLGQVLEDEGCYDIKFHNSHGRCMEFWCSMGEAEKVKKVIEEIFNVKVDKPYETL